MIRSSFPALAAVLLACGDAADSPPVAEAVASADSGPAAPAVRLALAGDGVMLVVGASGATRSVPFGTPDSLAVAAVAAALGAPDRQTANDECGVGRLEFVIFDGDGLILAIQDGTFAGWSVRPPEGAALRTMSGVGVGSTRAALEDVYAATIETTSLGIEFMAGGLQGVLAHADPDAPVVAFWAGASCVAR